MYIVDNQTNNPTHSIISSPTNIIMVSIPELFFSIRIYLYFVTKFVRVLYEIYKGISMHGQRRSRENSGGHGRSFSWSFLETFSLGFTDNYLKSVILHLSGVVALLVRYKLYSRRSTIRLSCPRCA